MLTVESVQHDFATVFRIVGRVDGENAPELQRSLLETITPGQRHLVLDLSGLTYISSMGLSSILAAGKKLDLQGGILLASGLSANVRQLFQFSGFDALFPIHATVEEALADCKGRSSTATSY